MKKTTVNTNEILILVSDLIKELNEGNLNKLYIVNLAGITSEKMSVLGAAILLKNTNDLENSIKVRIDKSIVNAISNCKEPNKINSRMEQFEASPLHVAVNCLDKSIIEALLKQGANPNIKNSFGNTPLMYAFTNESFVTKRNDDGIANLKDSIKLLISHGASPSIKNNLENNGYSVLKNFISHHGNYFKDILVMLDDLKKSSHIIPDGFSIDDFDDLSNDNTEELSFDMYYNPIDLEEVSYKEDEQTLNYLN